MPDESTIKKAKKDKEAGKSSSTQAGEFVHDEIEKIKHGEHGARSTKQAIAIGLSEARRAGVDLPEPDKGKYSEATRHKAEQDSEKGKQDPNHKPNPTRSKATLNALKRESNDAASPNALSKQAKSAAQARSPADRSASAKKAAESRTAKQRSDSAKKGAETRRRNRPRG